MNDDGRDALAALMIELQQALQALFDEVTGPARRRRRGPVLRRLVLGLELLSKIEEQLVLPALRDAAPGAQGPIDEALREIELLRDVALLVAQTARANREVALAVLEGLAFLHFAHMNALIARTAAPAPRWRQLESEARTWLDRWHDEVRRGGAVEDEDGDPVGAPAR